MLLIYTVNSWTPLYETIANNKICHELLTFYSWTSSICFHLKKKLNLTYIFFIYSYTTVSWLYRLFSNIYRSRSRRWYCISLCYYIPSYIEVFFHSLCHFHISNSFQLLKLWPILKYDVLYSPFGMLCVIISILIWRSLLAI